MPSTKLLMGKHCTCYLTIHTDKVIIIHVYFASVLSDGPCAGLLSDSEYSRLMKLSHAQWDQQDKWMEEQKEFGDSMRYTVNVRRKWIAEDMEKHFQLTLRSVKYNLTFFHGCSGVVKVVLKYIQNLF